MRKSLSQTSIPPTTPDTRATGWVRSALWAAAALSALVAAVAAADQAGGQRLISYTENVYASHQISVTVSLVYAIIYAVAVVLAVVWTLTAVLVGSRVRWTAPLTCVALAITGIAGVLLLTSSEYGERVFSPAWGILTLIPSVFGALAVALHLNHGRRPKGAR